MEWRANNSHTSPTLTFLTTRPPILLTSTIMFIYNGKFNWGDQAVNETITVVFPASFAVNDPVSVFFQWSKDPVTGDHSGVAVSNVCFTFNFTNLFTC